MFMLTVKDPEAREDAIGYLRSLLADNPHITIPEVEQRLREFLAFMNYEVKEAA